MVIKGFVKPSEIHLFCIYLPQGKMSDKKLDVFVLFVGKAVIKECYVWYEL
jgi:hypothetical protein